MGSNINIGIALNESYNRPLSTIGQVQAGVTRKFFLSGTTTFAPVYRDAALQVPYGQVPILIGADASGRFTPIYMDPAIKYRSQLLSTSGAILEDADPVNTPDTTTPLAVLKTITTTFADTTTGITNIDPQLQISIPGAGTYQVEVDVPSLARGAGGGDLLCTIGFNGTVNAAASNSFCATGRSNSFAFVAAFLLNTGTLTLGASPTGVNSVMRISGTIQVTSAGTLSFRWGPNAIDGNSTSLTLGTSMTATKVG